MELSAFDELKKHYQNPYLAAQDWKNNGGKVAGYFCDSVPEEMISAAGFFPLRINGDPQEPTDIARNHLIPRFALRETFVHSMLNKVLSGEYDFLDFLIIPHSRDSIHRLYQLLAMPATAANIPGMPELHFIDVPHTTFYSSVNYFRDRLIEFKCRLEEWSGKSITDAALSRAIDVANENRQLLQDIVKCRADNPSRISGVDALQLIGSAMFMQKEAHNALLKKYLAEDNDCLSAGKIRLFVSGSPADNLQLYEIIESCDAIIVAEDHCWGNRLAYGLIDTSLNPLDAICDRYLLKPPCPRMFPMKKRIDHCLQNIAAANVHGVIFNVYEHDEAEAWEIPEKLNAVDEIGLDCLYLKNQSYYISERDGLKSCINEFVSQFS